MKTFDFKNYTLSFENICSQLIMLVDKFPCGYKTIFVFIFIFKDVFHHQLMMCVVGRVAMFFKLFLQVLSHLLCAGRIAIIYDSNITQI